MKDFAGWLARRRSVFKIMLIRGVKCQEHGASIAFGELHGKMTASTKAKEIF